MKEIIKTNAKFNTVHILLYIFLLIIFVIVMKIISIRETYKAQYDWWYTNNGKEYDKFLNLTNLLLVDNGILFTFTKLFGNTYSNLDGQQIDFLKRNVLPFGLYTDTNGLQTGFVLPRHVTKDIKFKNGDNNQFDKWCSDPNRMYDTNVTLQYDPPNPPDPKKAGTRKSGNKGVYPSFDDPNGWKYKFEEWGILLSSYITDKEGVVKPVSDDNMYKEWFDTEKHPDNFLAKYGILPDCPLCISFTSGSYNSGGLRLDITSFKILIGFDDDKSDSQGGWTGYMKHLGDNDMNKYDDFIYAKYTSPVPKPTPPALPCNSSSASSWSSAVGSGLGIGAMAAFIGFSNPFTAGFSIFMILAGIGIGVASSPPLNKTC